MASAASARSAKSVVTVGSFHGSDDESDRPEDRCLGVPARAAWGLVANPFWVLGAWSLAFAMAAPFAPRLLETVRASYDPEPGMPSHDAKLALARHFPGLLDQTADSVLLTLRPGVDSWDAGPVVWRAADALDELFVVIKREYPGILVESRSWRASMDSTVFTSSFASEDERAYLVQVIWNASGPDNRFMALTAARQLFAVVRQLNATFAPQGVELASTGPHAFSLASMAQAREDIGWHSVMFLPVALLAMHGQLRRWRLLPLIMLCGLASIVLAFAIVYAIALRRTVDQNVPTFMAFLSTSLCIDWSFFLLARYCEEEALRGVQHDDALVTALSRTGTNVALSGLLLVACTACMLTMPTAISSSAVGGIVTVATALTSCLTLLPACLAAFPAFFGSGMGPSRPGLEAADSEGHVHATAFESLRNQTKVPQCEYALWYRWASFVTRFPANVVVLLGLCAALSPATLKLWSMVPAVEDSLCLPPRDPSVLAIATIRDKFASRPRLEAQLHLLLEASDKCADGVRSNGYFQSTCAVAQGFLAVGEPRGWLKSSDMLGVTYYAENDPKTVLCLTWRTHFESDAEAIAAMEGNFTPSAHLLLTGKTQNAVVMPGSQFVFLHALYDALWANLVSTDGRSSLMAVRLPWDTVTWRGFHLIEAVRKLLGIAFSQGKLGDDPCLEVRGWELSQAGVWRDYVTASVGRLPRAIGLACLVAAPFIALSFRSAVAPLKLLLTVVVPLTWVYGAAVWCFQDGLLDGWHFASALHSSGGLHWMVPCSTSMLLLALALDYNVFYFGRVLEFRCAGASDLEAIRQGLASTGPVITCAGAIFALEFSGLLFSEVPISRQGGFVVVAGTLLDTLVVRSCLVPAALSLGASWNWWPAAVPAASDPSETDPVLGSRMELEANLEDHGDSE